MFCPQCRSEFLPGVSSCNNCEVALVAELPDESPLSSPEGMAALLADKDLQAIVVGPYPVIVENQRLLAAAGIPSVVAPEDESEQVQPGLHNRLYLLVDPESLDAVRALFARRLAEGLAVEGIMLTGESSAAVGGEACPACGTAVPPTSEECPECGLFVGAAE